MLGRLVLAAAVAAGLPSPAVAQAPAAPLAERCQALEGGKLQDLPSAPTYIMKAAAVAATPTRQAYCAVEGYVNPTNVFGMYLPADKWNGRYIVRGCGGSCGTAAVELACGLHVRDGYACLITDMGHRSTLIDNNWVANNLQGMVDFGYRSTHVTTKAGKALIDAFYGKAALKSYFVACSTGGRQGLIEAQRFPQDFDGIVAIAPASLNPFGGWRPAEVSQVDRFNLDPSGKPILPNRKALMIHRAVVRACDMNDGVRDGLIGDPRRCRFEPRSLQCTGTDIRNCLTAAQVGVVEKFYTLRAVEKGSEFNWIGNHLRNAALPGEQSTPLFDLGVGRGDPVVVESMIAPNNPDLRAFRDRGGKLILVHGWSDYSTLPRTTVDYFETMQRTMGGPADTAKFARLFMIPGMDHCSGGEGASAIDYLAPIIAWVERGAAPAKLRGVHPLPGAPLDYFAFDLPNLDAKWIGFERDHYAYPGPSRPVGRTAPASANKPLTAALTEAVLATEKSATASGQPRRNVLNSISKAIWETFYRSEADAAAQAAALADVARLDLSPVARESVTRMTAELALD
jgi:feruloyl esterase